MHVSAPLKMAVEQFGKFIRLAFGIDAHTEEELEANSDTMDRLEASDAVTYFDGDIALVPQNQQICCTGAHPTEAQ